LDVSFINSKSSKIYEKEYGNFKSNIEILLVYGIIIVEAKMLFQLIVCIALLFIGISLKLIARILRRHQ